MNDDLWTRIDTYIEERLVPHDPALAAAVTASAAARLPAIEVSATHGKMLHLLARLARATRILEIGTLGGYSTIWLARGLAPGGRVVSLESEPRHAEIARRNLARANLDAVVQVRVGRALDLLPALEREGGGPFDLVFIDADKENNPHYIEWAVRLGRSGTLIVVDNVVRQGTILESATADAAVRGTRRSYELVSAHPRLAATAVQTVGAKGYDGFMLALVTDGGPGS
jgi:predicted O-methyltransferase YrrM